MNYRHPVATFSMVAVTLALVSGIGQVAAQQSDDQSPQNRTDNNQSNQQDPSAAQNEQATSNQNQEQNQNQNQDDLTEYRGHERASLGVLLSESGRHGVRITEVIPESPAARVGLQPGDRIRRMDNQEINSYRELIRLLNRKNPNDQVTVVYDRNGQQQQATVRLAQRQQVFNQERYGSQQRYGNRTGQYANQDQYGNQSQQYGNQQQRNQWPGQGQGGREDRWNQYDGRNEQAGYNEYGMNQYNDDRRANWQGQPMLGISVNPSRRGQGATVTNVYPGGPADRAGIRQGDQILSIDGRQVHSQEQIQEELSQFRPGEQIAIDIGHDGQRERLNAMLTSRDQIVRAGPSPEEYGEQGEFGDEYQNQNRRGGQEFSRNEQWQQGNQSWRGEQFGNRNRRGDQQGYEGQQPWMGAEQGGHQPAIGVAIASQPGRQGVLIAEVYQNSPADRAGIRSGDEIVALNGRQIRSAEELARDIERHQPHRPVELVVERNGRQRTLNVRLAERREIPEEASGQPFEDQFRGNNRRNQDQSSDQEGHGGENNL